MRGALVLLEKHFVREFERGEPAHARTDDASGTVAILAFEGDLKTRLGHGLPCRAARELRVLVGEHEWLAQVTLDCLIVWHLARNGDAKVLGGEAFDVADAAFAVLERSPKAVDGRPQRSDNALAGDHDAPTRIRFCHAV
jgi:hypothetical protein